MKTKAAGRRTIPPTEIHRSDYGTYRVTDRDWHGWGLVAEQKFVRFDTLGEWWAPGYAPALEEPSQDDSLPLPGKQRGGSRVGTAWPVERRKRLNAVAQIVARWQQKMQVAEIWQPFASQPPWVRMTQTGLRELGFPWAEIPFPARERLLHTADHPCHTHRINQIRLSLARGDIHGIPRDYQWHSEREIEASIANREPGTPAPHRPDGYLELLADDAWDIQRSDGSRETLALARGSCIAVEVELSRKDYPRLGTHILPNLLDHYDAVLYFCTKEAYAAVVAARRDYLATNSQRKRIRILLLAEEKVR